MQARIRNRIGGKKNNEEEDETKSFLLNRTITIKRNRNVELDYTISDFLGSGKFGDVSKCVEKSTKYELAAKIIPIQSLDDKQLVMSEVKIMSKLRHPRLIQLYDVYENSKKIILVMELITGGELFERIIDDNFELDEARCGKFMREILEGVDYIHSQNVLHLDLKPENILCLTKTGFKIKIIDFGLAREFDEHSELRVMFGTPEFIAPEVISYDPVSYSSDMWSVGVICYVLLSGLSPFMGDTEGETLSNIIRCNYDFNYTEFDDISTDAKDFIKKLLVREPTKRYTSSQCLSHPWFKEKPRLKRCATVSKKRLKHFVYRRKWQKATNAIIALLRMGVVLTHTTEQPEIRKYLKIQKTKTTAVFSRKISANSPPPAVTPSEPVKRQSTPASPNVCPQNSTFNYSKPNDFAKVPTKTNSPDSKLETIKGVDKKIGPLSPNTSTVQGKPRNGGTLEKTALVPKESKSTQDNKPAVNNTSSTTKTPSKSKPEMLNKKVIEATPNNTSTPKTPVNEKLIVADKVDPRNKIVDNTLQNNSAAAAAPLKPLQRISNANAPGPSAALAIAKLSNVPTGIASRIKLFSDEENTKKTSKPKKKISLYS